MIVALSIPLNHVVDGFGTYTRSFPGSRFTFGYRERIVLAGIEVGKLIYAMSKFFTRSEVTT